MNKKLIELANYLDAKGLRVEADMVDDIIKISNDDLGGSKEGDGVISIDVDIDAGEVRDLQEALDENIYHQISRDITHPGNKSKWLDNASYLGYKLKRMLPKAIRGFLSGMGPSDPLKNNREELEEAITRYVNRNFDTEGEVQHVEWVWHDAADAYAYDVHVKRPNSDDPDYMEHWAVWIGKLDEDIYYGPTERVGETNYHLAGEW